MVYLLKTEDENLYRWDELWYLGIIKKCPFVPTRQVGGVMKNKPRDIWIKEDKENV